MGYLRFVTGNINDTNLLVTKDYGDTYNLYLNDSVSHYKYDNTDNYMTPTQGIDLGNTILYTMRRGNDSSSYTIVLRYDTNFRLIDTVKLNCRLVHTILKTQDSVVFILGLNYSGENTTDSSGTAGNYKYSYFILKSTDKGKTWDSTYVPITQEIFKYDDGTYHYTNNIYSNPSTLTGNYILFPYPTFSLSKRLEGYSLIYRYDYKNNVFDSIKIPTTITENPLVIFSFVSKVFVASYQNNYLLSTNDISAKNPLWDSVNIAGIFSDWDSYDPNYLQNNKDAVLSFSSIDDSTGLLFIGKSRNRQVGIPFIINPVKISVTGTVNEVSEPKIDQERAYLWNHYPYPLPGKSFIQTKIYWNSFYDINDAKITIYDIYGRGGEYRKVKINKTQDYMGILEWNCSDAPEGVYVIQVVLAGESLSIPVIVVK